MNENHDNYAKARQQNKKRNTRKYTNVTTSCRFNRKCIMFAKVLVGGQVAAF